MKIKKLLETIEAENYLDYYEYEGCYIPYFEYTYEVKDIEIVFKYDPLYEYGTPADMNITIKGEETSYTDDNFEAFKPKLTEILGDKAEPLLKKVIRIFKNREIQAELKEFIEDDLDGLRND